MGIRSCKYGYIITILMDNFSRYCIKASLKGGAF